MGEGQLEVQLEWGDPQGPAEVQEGADSWARGFSTLCLLQKETLRVGATDGLPGRLLHKKRDYLKPFSSLELQESPPQSRGTTLAIRKKDSNTLLLEGTWSSGQSRPSLCICGHLPSSLLPSCELFSFVISSACFQP